MHRKRLEAQTNTYRRGDELGIIPFTPEEINTSIVDLVSCYNGTKNFYREANFRFLYLQGNDIYT